MRVAPALALVELLLASAAGVATLTEAQEAYDQNKVPAAERMFGEIAGDPAATADDRADAGVALARIAWLIDGNSKLALQRLDAARATGGKACDVSAMTARVLREAHLYQQAIGQEAALLKACTSPVGRDAVRIHAIGARLDEAAAHPGERHQLLQAAKSDEQLLTQDAGVEAARVRLETTLMTGDSAGALAAWKDYFWLDESDAPQALEHAGVTATFNNGLAAGASIQDRLKLADLLMRTGFADQSRRFADASGLGKAAAGTPEWKKLSAYWTARDRLEDQLLQQNRRFARRGDSPAVLKAEMDVLKRVNEEWESALLAAAGEAGDPKQVLLKAYGLTGTDLGTTNGYPSIHLGHVIEDHDDEVTQYGHSAKIHFMAIDNMVSNGFTSWLWDGSAMVGGWTANGVIVHVRPGYVRSPLAAWRLTQDTEDRRKLIARQAARAAEDIAKLKQKPIATLEGLNDRLQLQYGDQILAAVRSRATSKADVRRLFLAEYSKANLNQSIRVHEGRHAIDNAMGLGTRQQVDQAVLEENAKLSELALTAYPRMALRNMDRSLEGDGPHDRSAARIFEGYRKWMEAHTGEIMGFDPNVPVLEQMDKLTDSQIREIAMSLDPLAPK